MISPLNATFIHIILNLTTLMVLSKNLFFTIKRDDNPLPRVRQ